MAGLPERLPEGGFVLAYRAGQVDPQVHTAGRRHQEVEQSRLLQHPVDACRRMRADVGDHPDPHPIGLQLLQRLHPGVHLEAEH